MKKKRYFIYTFVILFLIITMMVLLNIFSEYDESVYNYLMSFKSDRMDAFFKTVTCFANTSSIIILSIFLVILLERKEQCILVSTLIGTVLLNLGFKYLIQRVRPDHLRLVVENGYSYPSGHSMISIALYGLMIYYIYQKESNRFLRIICISFLVLLIGLIGISRIYLGVHYPSDVLGGYFLSLAILLIMINSINKYWGYLNDKDGS